jgi:hypothetical protein
MRLPALAVLTVIYFALTAEWPSRGAQEPAAANTQRDCSPAGAGYMRTTIYFGLSHASGIISEGQWRVFMRDEVTPRFPDGLTLWEASGQWRRPDGRIAHERAKVVLLVHEEKPAVRRAIAEMVDRYKKTYHQESVLWETAAVCAAF